MYDQIAVLDPTPNRAGRNIERFGHRCDRIELRKNATALTATIGYIGAHDAAPPSEINASNEA